MKTIGLKLPKKKSVKAPPEEVKTETSEGKTEPTNKRKVKSEGGE